MNIKLKFSIIILATLILGMAIGFEISEISIKMHMKEIDSMREANGFIGMFKNIIKPDASQEPVIDSILLKYHKIIDSTANAGMDQVSRLVDSMRVELKRNLTPDQIERFDKETSRMKNGPSPRDMNRRPNMGPDHGRGPSPEDRNGPPPSVKGPKLLRPEGNRPPNNTPPPDINRR